MKRKWSIPWRDLQTWPWTVFTKEYPNKIAHVMSGDQDVGPPRDLTPVFLWLLLTGIPRYTGHWLLARLLRLNPEAGFAEVALAALEQSFQAEKVVVEVEYAPA